ncbi:MAG: G5 domain-containing protein [Oscillospiraceae bacterium]|nr:G5 domain-containing protein [Oscillospiraceae bacterium]
MAEIKKEKASVFTVSGLVRAVYSLCMLALVLSMSAVLYLRTTVAKITDGEKSAVILSTTQNEQSLMSMAGFEVKDTDTLLSTSFSNNYIDITIRGGIDVTVTADGVQTAVKLKNGTVQSALKEAGVELGEYDYTEPSLHTVLKPGDGVVVHRVEYVVNSYEETIPHGTTYKQSSLLFKRTKKSYTLSEGSNGKKTLTYTERYVDGEKTQRLLRNTVVNKQPVDTVVLTYGAGVPVSNVSAPAGVTVTNNVPTGYSRVLSMSATGYSSKSGKGASGLGLYYGTVAVNPNVIPYGTKMYIVSEDGRFVYGWAIATDTGTAMMEYPNYIDLFYETYTESVLNGRIAVNVYLYG